MSYETTDPKGAQAILSGDEGWRFLDVRTEEEFVRGHVPGAYNIPVMLRDPMTGMTPNPRFVDVVLGAFEKTDRLVLGCAAGMRSARACEMLYEAGFETLVNMDGGFSGAPDGLGGIREPGWEACGLPCETECSPERQYGALTATE